MRKRRRADLAAVRLVGAVADQIDAEFALRTFGRHINFARGDVETLGVELEVMDQRFHRLLHLATLRRHDLAVEAGDRAGRHVAPALFDDLRPLLDFLDAPPEAVVAIAARAAGTSEFQPRP